ncbi:MAG: thiamine pyrophosphate-binding protein, partial [Pseudomonadota bacterium]
MNKALARLTLDGLHRAGVRELCVCPGARNAPWIQSLAEPPCPFAVTWFFEERAAAFFALGRIRATGRPVAVLTTSGTAAGELLPATMEAYYAGLSLVLMTADRPRRFRGSGAPQTAEQPGLFGIYCRHGVDLATGDVWDPGGFNNAGPVHVNVCFED